jgi:8-oxo-dGTP pyrophosphatase MutT (NUDIX family)
VTGATPRPDWLDRLQSAISRVPPSWFSRFQPPADGGRQSAVLMLFGPGEDGVQQDVVLTERSHALRSHAGQVAFPGGALDAGDSGPVSAALREAREEVGLSPDGVEIVAELPALYLPPSNFVVTPVVAWWARPSAVRVVDTAEVARVVRAPLAALTDPERRFTVTHPSGYTGPAFEVEGLLVWGFTAGLLAKTLELAGLERPWDHSRHRRLPERFLRSSARSAPVTAARAATTTGGTTTGDDSVSGPA